MANAGRLAAQFLILLLAAVAVIVGDVQMAHAQSSACSRLERTLAELERNRDFRRSSGGQSELRRAEREVQRAESRYVREGCNADAKAGRRLSSQCRSLARDILSGREDVEQLRQSLDTGNAVAQQREAILQEMSRFGCGEDDSNVEVRRERRGNIFDELFSVFSDGGFDGEGGVRGEEFNPYGNYHTVRTLCVRKSDGFYWPISYSTLTDYVANDADTCRAMCPGIDVDLYYHDNPGQEPEQMINMVGEPYTALPNAFRFRTEFHKDQSCKAKVESGTITVALAPDGTSRATANLEEGSFPLPVRDPRGRNATIVAAPLQANFVEVPLPRRRPSEAGGPAQTVTAAAVQQPLRIVQHQGKRVRIVGPETPYALIGEAGT
jgi:plasmid stabilization system protein ParE